MSTAIDTYFAYRLVRTIATPWVKQPAYKAGIINEKGQVIKPASERSGEDNKIYNSFTKLGFSIKRIIEKMPGGKSKVASYASAMFLLKEAYETGLLNSLNEESIVMVAGALPSVDLPLDARLARRKTKKKNSNKEEGRGMKLLDRIKNISIKDEDIDETVETVFRDGKRIKRTKPKKSQANKNSGMSKAARKVSARKAAKTKKNNPSGQKKALKKRKKTNKKRSLSGL